MLIQRNINLASNTFRTTAIAQPALLFVIAFSSCFLALRVSADITIQRSKEMIDPSRITVAGKQSELGAEPQKLFNYVRGAIRYDAYQGALRGGRGTLIAEAGNSVDKSLLLFELLTRAGHRARFAHGVLDTSRTEQLASAIFSMATATSEKDGDLAPNLKSFIESITTESRDQYQTIVKTLTDGGFQIPHEATFSHKDLIAELRDHCWVQYFSDGKWTDLDPSFSDAKIGQSFTEASEITETIPENLFHRIGIRVIVEEQTNGQRQKRTLLTYQAKASDLSGSSIVLTHEPGSWERPIPMTALASSLSKALTAMGGATREDKAKPVLIIGTEYRVGELFDMPLPEHEVTSKKAARSLTDIGDLIEGNKPSEIKATGEWIEFEFTSPDGKAEKTERTIFDRIGFSARQKGGGEVSTAPLGIEHPLAAMFCLSFYTGPLNNVAVLSNDEPQQRPERIQDEQKISVSELTSSLKVLNHSVEVFSDRLLDRIGVDSQQAVYSFYSPRLIISTLRASEESMSLSIDLRRTRYRVIANAPAISEKSFRLQILKGVLDGEIEGGITNFLSGTDRASGKTDSGSYSASRIFQQSRSAGIKPRLLKGMPNDTSMGLPDEPMARVSADLNQGYLLVLPEKAVSVSGKNRVGWWRVDQKTGETIGVTQDGLYGSEECVIVIEKDTEVITVFIRTAPGKMSPMGYPGGGAWTYERLTILKDVFGKAIKVIQYSKSLLEKGL